jgi:pimeloyl-ACP methyl ester carboxylesterase
MMKEKIGDASEASLAANAARAIQVIIRPPRATYDLADVGPVHFPGNEAPIPRIPIAFKNRNGHNLVGSVYISGSFYTEEQHLCVIYLHGNVGSQKEGRFIVPYLAPRGISVFCFDFSGSGLSGGDFVTLGSREHLDVIEAINFLNVQFQITDFVLWGRSMGSACAVMAASLSPLIRGIIVDSPYASISKLFSAISQQVPLPSVIRPIAVWWIKQEVQKKANFDCDEVQPIESAKRANCPLMLGHATDDDFVPYKHGVQIFQAYACPDKEMVTLTGGHNGQRDPGWIMKCLRFILRVFGLKFHYFEVVVTCDNVEHVGSFRDLMGTTT